MSRNISVAALATTLIILHSKNKKPMKKLSVLKLTKFHVKVRNLLHHCLVLVSYKNVYSELLTRFFLYISMSIKKLKNTIQYSVQSIAEIDMSSFGSGYERHLTNSLTTIEKEKNNKQEKQSKRKELKHSVHHDITPPPTLTSASMR